MASQNHGDEENKPKEPSEDGAPQDHADSPEAQSPIDDDKEPFDEDDEDVPPSNDPPTRTEIEKRMWTQWAYETELITTRYRFLVIINTSLFALLVYAATQEEFMPHAELIFYQALVMAFGQLTCFFTHRSIMAAIHAQKHIDLACRWLTYDTHKLAINQTIFRNGWSDVTRVPWLAAIGWLMVSFHLLILFMTAFSSDIPMQDYKFVIDTWIQDFLLHHNIPAWIPAIAFPLGSAIIFCVHLNYHNRDRKKYKKRLKNISEQYKAHKSDQLDASQEDIRDFLFNKRKPGSSKSIAFRKQKNKVHRQTQAKMPNQNPNPKKPGK